MLKVILKNGSMEEEGGTIIRNFGNHLEGHTASLCRRARSISSLPAEPHISVTLKLSRPRWSSGSVLAVRPKIRGFKADRGRWTFEGDKHP
jgi:hypothetical protein